MEKRDQRSSFSKQPGLFFNMITLKNKTFNVHILIKGYIPLANFCTAMTQGFNIITK